MNSNFPIKINIDGFLHSHVFRWYNYDFRIAKIVEIFEKFELKFKNQHSSTFIMQYLFKNRKNFISGFFPDFPDPVFPGKKWWASLGEVELLPI